jgi:hypothetical protein
MRPLFRELVRRLDHIELPGPATWARAHFVEGPNSIPVRDPFR